MSPMWYVIIAFCCLFGTIWLIGFGRDFKLKKFFKVMYLGFSPRERETRFRWVVNALVSSVSYIVGILITALKFLFFDCFHFVFTWEWKRIKKLRDCSIHHLWGNFGRIVLFFCLLFVSCVVSDNIYCAGGDGINYVVIIVCFIIILVTIIELIVIFFSYLISLFKGRKKMGLFKNKVNANEVNNNIVYRDESLGKNYTATELWEKINDFEKLSEEKEEACREIMVLKEEALDIKEDEVQKAKEDARKLAKETEAKEKAHEEIVKLKDAENERLKKEAMKLAEEIKAKEGLLQEINEIKKVCEELGLIKSATSTAGDLIKRLKEVEEKVESLLVRENKCKTSAPKMGISGTCTEDSEVSVLVGTLATEQKKKKFSIPSVFTKEYYENRKLENDKKEEKEKVSRQKAAERMKNRKKTS